ncbi:MAG: TldD/PmbA family protein [Candidatus Woesearchaeota archaeon]|nr:TldD/PmbA family protein [Candidatus Woesearchaeota archaeon]
MSKARKDLLGRLVNKLEQHAPYADALYSENTTRVIAKNTAEIECSTDADAGVKVRAYDGTQFHEVCVQGWQPQLMQAEVHSLIERLKHVEGKTATLKLSKERADKDFTVAYVTDPATVPIQKKFSFIEALHAKVQKKPFINCIVSYREEEEHRIFVNKYKRLASTWTGCTVTIVPFVQTASGETRSDHFTNFRNGFEVTDIDEEDLKAFMDRAAKLKTAKKLPPGKYTAILSPTVTGLLAHESFGHGMESDTILHGRAKAAEYIGKKISNVKVNICEDASLPSTHGFLFFDDEGMMPKRVFLVERGTVKQPISEAYSASRKSFPRTANGRAEAFDHKVYARMTNTFFLSGKDDPVKMIKSVRNGIYIHTGSSGMEDPKGWGVQLAGLLCERIKNGKLTGELFYEASMGGYLPDILGNIKMVGKDFEIIKDVGFCGKEHKEWVRVSSGGPHVLIREVELS